MLLEVGYWRSVPYLWDYPRPQSLIAPGWRAAERPRIVRYLQSGKTHTRWRGYSRCRFPECGAALGSRCLTDGRWLWPEGLEHYIEHHDVMLPRWFIDEMTLRKWQVPEVDEDEIQQEPIVEAFWINWARKTAKSLAQRHQPPPVPAT
ncbi:hypothetical protein [Microbulbifer guangxiensis]|uniref:hypothetical protein n=1 Tax=Microbulbifer guangxiensis TaxID=2904249 RepID=UPI001F44CC7B|nr:hypothetical protein [Microbulbifer guangxiensis]